MLTIESSIKSTALQQANSPLFHLPDAVDSKLIRSAGIEYEKIPIEYSIQKNLTLARSKLGIWIDDGAIHSN